MKYLFVVGLSLICVYRVEGQINCHQCASKDNLDCLDPYDGPVMEDEYSDGCEDTDTHCSKFKIISRLYDSGFINGKPRETDTITRGCIRAPGQSDGCKYIESDAGFWFHCICSGDNCNGSGVKVISMVAMVICLVLTAFSRYIIV